MKKEIIKTEVLGIETDIEVTQKTVGKMIEVTLSYQMPRTSYNPKTGVLAVFPVAKPVRIYTCGECKSELKMREVDGLWMAECTVCDTTSRWYSSPETAASKFI